MVLAAGTLEGASEGGMQMHYTDHGFEETQELFLLLSSRIHEIPLSLAGDSITFHFRHTDCKIPVLILLLDSSPEPPALYFSTVFVKPPPLTS